MGLLIKNDEIDEENKRLLLYGPWGDFLSKKNLYTEAINYYTKYLEIDDNDPEAHYHRSLCYCNNARSEDALKDAKTALKLIPHRPDFNFQVSEGLFECNDFENSKIEVHNNIRKFEKTCNNEKLENRLNIILQNYSQTFGNKYSQFAAHENFEKIFDKLKKNDDYKNHDKSYWKILKEQDKCDVDSIFEKEKEKETLLHPREIERRKLCYKNFTQLYLHQGAKDIKFLAELRFNDMFLLPQTTKSTRKLKALANENYDLAFKFVKMLQARGPVYTQKFKTGRNQLIATREKENHILRLQCQTRGEMFNILKRLHTFRNQGKLGEVFKLVDYTIREYVIIKTNKVMPRKYEFINDVCNILALSYIDKFKMPNDIFSTYGSMEQLQYLFNIPVIRDKLYSQVDIFIDKSNFKELLSKEGSYIKYKNRLNILENRLRFAIFPIEKCYIYYAIANSHLKQAAYEMCLTIINNLIIEAKISNNLAWEIVGYHLICKTLLAQTRLERLQETVLKAIELANQIKNKTIYNLFQLINKLITNVLKHKAKRILMSMTMRQSK